jgi:glycogen(starch) synthase
MRILIINSEYPPVGGGAANASQNLAIKLVELGSEVRVLTSHYGQLPKLKTEQGVPVQRIQAFRRNQARSGGFEQGIFVLSGIFGLTRLLRGWQPDIILSFFGVPSGAITWLTKWKTGIPYVVSLRGGDVPGFRPYDFALYHRLISPVLRRVWHHAGAVIANSTGLKELAEEFDHHTEVQIIPNGVDANQFTLPNERNWDPTEMLFVGRLVYQKGIDLLIEALSGLKSHSWRLNLVGIGPHQPFLEDLAKKRGILDRIDFKGWLSGTTLIQEYKKANVFVFPSRHEGMPNAVLEAMACGLPVVATQIAGNQELVIPGETGLLVPPDDVTSLNAALDSILTNSETRMKMGAAGRKLVEDEFTWDRTASQYLAVMQKIIG